MTIEKRRIIEPTDIIQFAMDSKTHPVWAEILLQREIDTLAKAREFFIGGEFYLPKFSCAEEVSGVFKELVRQGKRFLVYGDYDVDGVTSTTIMVRTLQMIGANVNFFIPSRFNEGYGLNQEALEARINDFDVLVTVDTGITAIDPVAYLKSQGKTVIITDHHMLLEERPCADYIVHPFLDERNLKVCGAFVALQVAKAVLDKVPFYLEFLAGMGTVADQMPLIGPNRNLVRYVVEKLGSDRPFPIPILFSEIKYDSMYDWQFKIIPMLNSAGRMDSASYAVYFLMSTSYDEAYHYFHMLKDINEERKKISAEVRDKAIEYIEQNNLVENAIIIVPLVDSHEGVNGIVSSQILQRYGKPTVVMYRNEENKWVGSGRSKNLNIHHTLSRFEKYFDRFGGHDFAVGLTILDENLQPFLDDIASGDIEIANPDVVHEYDVDMELANLSVTIAKLQDKFQPFGQANPEIVFRSTVNVGKVTPLKDGKFFKIQDKKHKEISFLFWEKYEEQIKRGDVIDIVYKISVNEFRGVESVSATKVYYEKVVS